MDKKRMKKWLLLVVIPVLIELLICNYQFWITHICYPDETVYTTSEIQFGEGLNVNGSDITVENTDNCTLTLDGIDKTVRFAVFRYHLSSSKTGCEKSKNGFLLSFYQG